MSEYILTENLYLGITPGGTYYAVQDKADEPGRDFLHRLMQELQGASAGRRSFRLFSCPPAQG